MKRIYSVSITLIAVLLLAVLTTGSALASEGDEIGVVGTVIEINPEDGTVVIDVDGDSLTTDDIFTVHVGENFNFETIAVGDIIDVMGTEAGDGTVVLSELKIQDRIKDQLKLQDGEGDAYFCEDLENAHPVAEKVAGTYGVSYEVILGYLCDEPSVPLGQIMLALQTAALTGESFDVYLNGFEQINWGEIWKDLDLQGKPDKGTAPGQIQDKKGDEDPEGSGDKGKKNKDGEGLLECEDGDFFCEVYEWFQPQKGKK